jgi:mono/diheme cytochrome c family protein
MATLKHRPRRTRASSLPYFTALLGGAVAIGAATSATGGCSEPTNNPIIPGGATVGSGATDAGPASNGEPLFRALEQDLYDACGSCHDAGGIANSPFLRGPDRYDSVLQWRNLVTKPATDSLFLTWSVTGGGHSGINLDALPSLEEAVTAWLEEEALGIGDPVADVGPSIKPITPILGFNALYLDALGAEYTGMALTFYANELTETTLQLTNLEVQPTFKLGVHLVHPLFVVFPKNEEAEPDPIDSFSNLDDYFPAGEVEALGPGTVVLTNWSKGARLSVAFEKIEPFSSENPDGGDGGPTGGCLDVDSFIANAQGPLAVCGSCHSGQNGGATGAIDMTELTTNAAAACSQVRNRIKPDDPPASQVFISTDPNGNSGHQFKFNGDANAFNAFRTSLSVWITAEQ